MICTDYGTSITRLERVLEEADQPGVLERLRVVQVQYAAAAEIAGASLRRSLNPVARSDQSGGQDRACQGTQETGLFPRARAFSQHGAHGRLRECLETLLDVRTNKLIIIAQIRRSSRCWRSCASSTSPTKVVGRFRSCVSACRRRGARLHAGIFGTRSSDDCVAKDGRENAGRECGNDAQRSSKARRQGDRR